MTLISKFVIISLIVTIFYFIGLLTYINDYDENKCEMTYMFEYPQFVKIKIPSQDHFPRYGLYAYSEGKLTEKVRSMNFDGIPVLFVPGNAGSYKQVRSLASVALRKALNSRPGYYFDFFTLDLNNELSGLNGGVLNDQTKFLNVSIHRILDLYHGKTTQNRPKSVILIGHSMGGVIAQNVIDTTKVNLLISLASPHRRPSISLDGFSLKYYEDISQKFSNSSLLENKTMITIGGGHHDQLVNSWLTNSNYSSLNVITTGVPKVWLSTDHSCIMWCKQLVLAIIRALFDCIDVKTNQLSLNPQYRLAVFKHHLLTNSGTNIRWADRYKIIVQFDNRGDWIEDIRRQYTVNLAKGVRNNQWYMIRIVDDPKHEALFVQANNLAVTDWIFACTADGIRRNSRFCENGIHLSHQSAIAPSAKIKRRTHYINLFKLKKRYPKITHVVVRVLPTSEPVSINFDVHNPADRSINVQLPRWFSLSRTTVISKTDKDSLRYEVNLLGLQHIIQFYLMYIEPVDCEGSVHHSTASLLVPWANHDSHTFITETLKKPLLIRLHSSKPPKVNATAKIILNLDPTCQYTITVRNSFIGMLGQFARFYTPLLIANLAAVILMSYRSQLISLDEKNFCSLFQSSLSMSTKPYYLVTSAKLLSKALSFINLPDILPPPDTQILIDERMDFLILPLILYITSVGLIYLISLIFWAGIIMNESTVHKIVGKFFTRTIGKSFKMSDWFINAMHRVPSLVAATLLCLGLVTCGGLAICLGTVYYFLKLTQLCQDFIENLVYGNVKKIALEYLSKFFKKFRKPVQNKDGETVKIEELELEKIEQKDGETEKKEELEPEKIDDKKDEIVNESDKKLEEEVHDDEQEKKTDDKEKTVDDLEEELKLMTEEDKSEEQKDEQTDNGNNEMHFHFTLFLIWFIIACLNVPAVLTWAHNFKYNNILSPDPSSAIGLVLCSCAIFLWQFEIPKPNKRFYREMGFFVYAMALLSLIYAPLHLHRLSYILTATLCATVLHQLLAPDLPEENQTKLDPVSMYKEIKAKLE